MTIYNDWYLRTCFLVGSVNICSLVASCSESKKVNNGSKPSRHKMSVLCLRSAMETHDKRQWKEL